MKKVKNISDFYDYYAVYDLLCHVSRFSTSEAQSKAFIYSLLGVASKILEELGLTEKEMEDFLDKIPSDCLTTTMKDELLELCYQADPDFNIIKEGE